MTRPLRPNVITVGDNPVAQIKCEPEKDEVDTDALLKDILARFEFGIGTSFDLQLLTMDGKRLLAMRRFIVTTADEEIITSSMSFGQSMTRTVQHRDYEPISDWFIFDASAAGLRYDGTTIEEEVEEDVEVLDDISNASPTWLQQFVKSKRGKGFPPGTSHATMVEEAKKYL